LRAIDVTLH